MQGLNFILSGISRRKVKNEKFQGGFEKSISSIPPFWIFSGIAHFMLVIWVTGLSAQVPLVTNQVFLGFFTIGMNKLATLVFTEIW